MDDERSFMVERYMKEISILKENHIIECNTQNFEAETSKDNYKKEILELKQSLYELEQIKEEYENQEVILKEKFDIEFSKLNDNYLEKEKVRRFLSFFP